MDAIIRAENVSKMYRIGTSKSPHASLSEALAGVFTEPFKNLGKMGKPVAEEEMLWALHDVSFQVREGEAVGIIGRNGAGKSTLLKVLSRITEPTGGQIVMHGRVASLLEVGVGFHPELTGRENIFLNGAILGMRRKEIEGKFEEIVAFAEIERLIDTPVKRYSSGMYVRLAFAVAAHLEPEILLVDEVLAVGDMSFQKKCLGKMGDVARQGRTVLFVSHNMAAVKALCQRGIVLSQGRVVADDTAQKAVERYLAEGTVSEEGARQWEKPQRDVSVWPMRLEMRNEQGEVATYIGFDESALVEVELQVYEQCSFQVGLVVFNSEHVRVLTTNSEWEPRQYQPGVYRFQCVLPSSLLVPDQYRLALDIHHSHRETLFFDEYALSWVVEETGSKLAKYTGLRLGVVAIEPEWSMVASG